MKADYKSINNINPFACYKKKYIKFELNENPEKI